MKVVQLPEWTPKQCLNPTWNLKIAYSTVQAFNYALCGLLYASFCMAFFALLHFFCFKALLLFVLFTFHYICIMFSLHLSYFVLYISFLFAFCQFAVVMIAFCFMCILWYLNFVLFAYFVLALFSICILSFLSFVILPSSALISASAGLRWSSFLICTTHPPGESIRIAKLS